jgi:hypothetical protein
MKLSNLFMIALLAGTLGVFGCNDDPPATGNGGSGGEGTAGTGGSGTAGTGGSGTAGSGGSGTMCDATVEEVCAECDVPSAAPNCEATYNTCLADPVTVNPCESCALLGLADCGP